MLKRLDQYAQAYVSSENAFNCTKAFFHPFLNKKVDVQQEVPIGFKSKATVSRNDNIDKNHKKLLNRAAKRGIDQNTVTDMYRFLTKFFSQGLELNLETITQLGLIMNADYSEKLKPIKFMLFIHLVNLAILSQNSSYYPVLMQIVRAIYQQVQDDPSFKILPGGDIILSTVQELLGGILANYYEKNPMNFLVVEGVEILRTQYRKVIFFFIFVLAVYLYQ